MTDQSVPQLVEHLFRHKAGEIVAGLTRLFGFERLELIEDVVQETLLRALRHWSYRGVPDNPAGWIITTARNCAIDALRRERTHSDKSEAVAEHFLSGSGSEHDAVFAGELPDNMLRLMFACCHPALSPPAQVALILKTLGGFSAKEIAHAFLISETTAAQRIVRARQTLRAAVQQDRRNPLDTAPSQTVERLDSVLRAFYLMFNEGYNAYQGDNLVRFELVAEALRLVRVLTAHAVGGRPDVWALRALMCFQAARLPGRVSTDGDFVPLARQDRATWDGNLIAEGFTCLDRSTTSDEMTAYHLEAGIAACHVSAPDFAATDWRAILSLYDDLCAVRPSSVAALNRVVAFTQVYGPAGGLEELDKLSGSDELAGYYLYHATRADLLEQLDRAYDARISFRAARDLTASTAEQRYIDYRINHLTSSS
jgi:RNA polymerase sigma-70 factor (ECF subfamily)